MTDLPARLVFSAMFVALYGLLTAIAWSFPFPSPDRFATIIFAARVAWAAYGCFTVFAIWEVWRR